MININFYNYCITLIVCIKKKEVMLLFITNSWQNLINNKFMKHKYNY